jgi:copper chaperone CopZ
MKKIKLDVKGMHCKSCEMLIQESVYEVNGIINVKADHKKGYAEITFDESKADESKMKDAIRKEGYDVK